ncbi:MerR family transcriptional regulator [Microbacterium sp.]|uniref:MerR family transcriptional regulator n=1 Tax=Microbacterium sp. TaxID=51671 RepID=UPI003C7498B3
MRIGELSARSGVSARSLRYYEAQRLIAPERTTGGQRVYSPHHLALVVRIQELFRAGFCSSVIQELLPALGSPAQDDAALAAAFDAAAARLISEKESIDAELSALHALRSRLGLAPDTHVSVQRGFHDSSPDPPPAPAPFDHRDRRLRRGGAVLP